MTDTENKTQIIEPASARVFHELWRSSEKELSHLEAAILEYANDLRRNSSGSDDYPWEYAKATADYLETLITRSQTVESGPLSKGKDFATWWTRGLPQS